MKTVIVEDSQLIQTWLASVLLDIPGVHVAGCAVGEDEALALIEHHRPDLVLLDLSLSPGHGFNVLKAMRAKGNRCKVLILTNQDLKGIEGMARELGADGVHDKNADIAQVVSRITEWVRKPPAAAA
jgi:DNA-binding response OmpR family regulator